MRDYYKEFCSKCKHKELGEIDSPCKECSDAFFDDWKNPKRKFGKYFVKGTPEWIMKGDNDEQKQNS